MSEPKLRCLDPDDPLHQRAVEMAERMWSAIPDDKEFDPSALTAAVVILLSHFMVDYVKDDHREQFMDSIRASVLRTTVEAAARREVLTATKQ